MSCNNQLNVLAEKRLHQLMETNGIGQAKATTLLAAFELSKRMRAERVTEARHIRNAFDVVELMQDKIARLPHEEFWVIYLNQASKILKTSQIGKGGLSSTVVDVRLIIQESVILEATHIIVCHNHPSGSVKPSNQDKLLTQQIKNAAGLLKIQLSDHIILHKNSYFSFLEEGML
jgi:DNA repair protein RadC